MPIRAEDAATADSMIFKLGTAVDSPGHYVVCWNSGEAGAEYVRISRYL